MRVLTGLFDWARSDLTGPFDWARSDLTGLFDWARSVLTGPFDWARLDLTAEGGSRSEVISMTILFFGGTIITSSTSLSWSLFSLWSSSTTMATAFVLIDV